MSLVESGSGRVVGTGSFKWSDVLSYGGYEPWDDSRQAQITRLFNEVSVQLTLLKETDQPASERWHFNPLKLTELLNRSALLNDSDAKFVTQENLSDLKFLVNSAISRYSSEGTELIELYNEALNEKEQAKAKVERAIKKSQSLTDIKLKNLNEKVASRAAQALDTINSTQKIIQQSAEKLLSLNLMKLEFFRSLDILRVALIAHPLYRENGLNGWSNFKNSECTIVNLVNRVEDEIGRQMGRTTRDYGSDEDSDSSSDVGATMDDADFDSDSDNAFGFDNASKMTTCMNLLDRG